MKIYLAGKCNGKKWQLVAKFKHLCQFCASDGGLPSHGTHGWKGGVTIGAERWGRCNDAKPFFEKMVIDRIGECDGLIAYLDTDDSFGSVAEIAFASAIGRPCHLIVEEHETDYDTVWDAYWFVGSFPKVRVYRVEKYEDAAECVMEILETFGVRVRSFVYFIEAIGRNEIKIGSSVTPERRVPGLQTGNGSELKLLGKVRGNKDFEYMLHRKFDHLRLSRDLEWFRATDELRDFIAKNCEA